FKAVVRKKRADGFYPVYIRIVHRSRMGYIKTSKIVTDKQLSKAGDIKDPVVNDYCAREILRYSDALNRKDVSRYTVGELIEYLTNMDEETNFSEYAEAFISRMREEGHVRNAKNYKLALDRLQRYLGTTEVMFSRLTATTLSKWINSLSMTSRAKEMYPTCIRQIFKKALVELNDEERGIIRIKYNPWLKVEIPKSDKTTKLAISAEACRKFFNRPLPQTKMLASTPELGRDVAMLIFCLGGINTVDLYNLKKEDYHDGIICYNRAKTKNSRSDEAYMEMRVEPFIQATFNKYLAGADDEYLFVFHSRYKDADSFNAGVNVGIKKICKDMGMKKEEYYHGYTFRHTWATIAQNDCDANISDVAFGLNHSHGFNVTRGYVKIDFTPAWELNARIIDFVFFTNKTSKQGKAQSLE
ncbi:transposase, partial [gut metagenome]